jgi:hypothetical protein
MVAVDEKCHIAPNRVCQAYVRAAALEVVDLIVARPCFTVRTNWRENPIGRIHFAVLRTRGRCVPRRIDRGCAFA